MSSKHFLILILGMMATIAVIAVFGIASDTQLSIERAKHGCATERR